jgi:hypothetical protein
VTGGQYSMQKKKKKKALQGLSSSYAATDPSLKRK